MNIAFYKLVAEEDKPTLLKLKDIKSADTIYGNNPQVIADWCKSAFYMNRLMQEEVYLLFLHNSLRVKGIIQLAQGSEDSAVYSTACLYREVLLSGVSKIVITHNHPSGELNPSKQDIMTTNQLMEGCKLLGITLLDHIIIGEGYYSFHEQGLLEGREDGK